MDYPWYKIVNYDSPITQGDLILGIPLPDWKPIRFEMKYNSDPKKYFEDSLVVNSGQAIVLTQACDIEQGNAEELTLCLHYGLEEQRKDWVTGRELVKKKTGKGAWENYLKQIRNGYQWDYALLADPSESGLNEKLLRETELYIGARIVDFQRVFSIPMEFIKNWLKIDKMKRLSLLPPYREHLSQSFARYFMRVGLPAPIRFAWDQDQK